jgi:hypothetical protein
MELEYQHCNYHSESRSNLGKMSLDAVKEPNKKKHNKIDKTLHLLTSNYRCYPTNYKYSHNSPHNNQQILVINLQSQHKVFFYVFLNDDSSIRYVN